MAALPEDMSIAIDELETAIAEIESRLETARAERDEAKGRQVELEIENANLRRELALARERQGASADIIGAIASAPGNAAQVLQQIAETTARLFGAPSVSIQLAENGEWASAYRFGDSAVRVRSAVPIDTIRIGGPNLPGTVIAENRQIHIPDLDDLDPAIAHWPGPPIARAAGTRVMCGTPLRRADTAIGVLVVYRDRPLPFTAEELTLLQSFADQAVIAIENARLIRETREALERQTATAEILKVIASSPSDVQPVFDAIADSANRLIGGFSAAVFRFIDRDVHLTAFTPIDPAADEALKRSFPQSLSGYPPLAMIKSGETVQIADTEALQDMQRDIARARGFRSVVISPLMSNGLAIGSINVTRADPGAFAPHHIQLLQTFADQAVIAIENTRLFNETREALERQTATADILKVIASSPSDVQPVFDAIASSAKRLLGGFSAAVFRYVDGMVQLAAFTPTHPAADQALRADFPTPVDDFAAFRLAAHGQPFPIPDTEEVSHAPVREIARLHGFRSMLWVPMVNGGVTIGVLSVTRAQPGSFAPHQTQLLQTFADQAVIAIENTRLFNETQEALERQTATADILKVIASSPSDVQPVFDAIAHSARRLIGGFSTAVHRIIDDIDHLAAFTPTTPESDEILQAAFPRPLSEVPAVALGVNNGETAQIADSEAADQQIRTLGRARGWRSATYTPLMNQGTFIGFIVSTRREPGLLADRHVQLLRTFADQAVIAIENTRLFNETKEALERQTATADILKVIASSPSDVQPVFDAIAASAKRLLSGFSATVYRFIDGQAHLEAFTPTTPEADDILTSTFPRPVVDFTPFRMTQTGEVVQVPDTEDPSYELSGIARARGYRSMLFAPLMSKGASIGFIAVTRVVTGTFSDHHVQLLRTFADQAIIAIENTRLFNEVQARTEELSESLQQQTAVGDVLKTISRSTFDLQPVLDTLVGSAAQLCDADMAFIMRRVGNEYRAGAAVGYTEAYIDFLMNHPLPVDRGSVTGRAVLEGRPVQIPDVMADPEYTLHQTYELANQRTTLGVPLLRENEPIGTIVLARKRVEPFTQKQIDLVATFADQAVIAIENVRLFKEVQQRTDDLSESLRQQTTTADVLKVISRSAFDLETVLDTLTASAAGLCDADMAAVTRPHPDGGYHHATRYNFPPEWDRFSQATRVYPDRGSLVGRVLLEGRTVQIPDVLADPEYAFPEQQRAGGYRTLLGVPLLREGQTTGVLFLGRNRVESFSDKQIELVQTFADQAVIAIENVRLFDEVQARTRDLEEALTYQTGSANILRVIASSPTDVQPVLTAIVENACAVCDANDAIVFLEDGGELRSAAHHGPIPEGIVALPITPTRVVGRTFIEQAPVHVRDLQSEEGAEFPDGQELALRFGHRTVLAVPLLRDGKGVGVIMLRRNEVQPFNNEQIRQLQTFADQAVIAIGNVRLFEEVQAKTRDLTEALTYQTGSANILKVIASSPTDINPVLNSIVESACELCGAYDAVLRLKHGDELTLAAHRGMVPADWQLAEINPFWTAGRAILEQRPIHVHDMSSSEGDEFPQAQARALEQGHRTILSIPLLREGNSVGSLTLRRLEVNPFTDKQIALLQTFADQAVIAIGNVRLFEEVQAKTRDLTEALTYQTGSANILRVIASSPTDVKPVLQAIVESACELCDAYDAMLRLKNGDHLDFSAHHGPIPVVEDSVPISRNWTAGLAVIEQKTVHVHDLLSSEGDAFPGARERARRFDLRTILTVPLLREGESIGAIMLRRNEVMPFTEKQIALLQTFADQAVIAIGNVRLFEEVQDKTRDLSEALTYQTGSANILKVIASSPTDIKPVFQAIVESACELCDAYDAVLRLKDGDNLCFSAHHGPISTFTHERPINRDWSAGRAVIDQNPVQIADLLSPEGDEFSEAREIARQLGHRTVLSVPLLREGESLGAITLRRKEVHPFTDKQIALLQTFADQAVIAIGNVRLFEEVQARTRELTESLQQQTATSDVLQVISSSPGDLAPVFEKMLVNATRVCGAEFGSLLLTEDGSIRVAAQHNVPAEFAAAREKRVLAPHPDSPLAVSIRTKQVIHEADLRTTEPYLERHPGMLELVDLGGVRTIAIVPMLRDDEVIGAISVYRNEVQLFSDKQIDLLSNFAKQAVIAIENARLLSELRQRTADLSQSLDDLRTAQDRLVQTEKLASLGQLTAGIAHEIKNPLNFVNNFAALSAELTEELNESLKPVVLAEKLRTEVDELTGLLKSNLEKVVQHGKRADSIVRNMLLHSREGGGEHRPSDINALIDESLNLAYHGARAERPDFNVTLERDFDPAAGEIDLFPQEITRVILNMVANGFYAVTKRRKEGGGTGFEPTLRASTKNLGDAVEIRIRDNGTGIPTEVKERMFNPFFTTKPAGEGTGLGLSMSHDIIVKQHGGTIDVDTEQGHFTEFRIVLPRTSNFADKSRG